MVSQAAVPRPLERPRLRRRTEHRLVAGVAGGIADSLNAPVAFVRVMLALAWAWAPWLLWAYAAAALLLPAAERNRPDWDNLLAAGRVGVLWGVTWLALPDTIHLDEELEGSAGLWLAYGGVLLAGAVALLSADYRRGRPRSPAEARSAVLAAAPVAACAVLLAAGLLLAPDVRWERYLPAVVAVGGVAMLVAPRRRELAGPALLALGVTALVAAAGARLEGGLGDARVTPAATAGEPVVARRAVGDLTVDLRGLRGGPDPVTVVASVGVGDLRVAAPRNARVTVDGRVGLGSVEGYGRDFALTQGLDVRATPTFRGYAERVAPGLPVRVIADVGIGSVQVEFGPGAFGMER
jgi:phage shock protein PspC (stress-responsive transcriptional regulator)